MMCKASFFIKAILSCTAPSHLQREILANLELCLAPKKNAFYQPFLVNKAKLQMSAHELSDWPVRLRSKFNKPGLGLNIHQNG